MNFDLVNVNQYDFNREIPQYIQKRVLKLLLEKFPVKEFPLLFEPGIGTGRWAIPFAKVGYNVFGIDISQRMLNELGGKILDYKDISLHFESGDVYSINSSDNHFNLCLISHLFHLLSDIKIALNEIIRVIKNDGSIIHIKSGKGNSIPELSVLYFELLRDYGYKVESFSDRVQVAFEFLKERGYRQLDIVKEEFSWVKKVKLCDGISLLNNHSFSFTNITPRNIHNEIMSLLVKRIINKYGSLDKEIAIHNQIQLTVFQRL